MKLLDIPGFDKKQMNNTIYPLNFQNSEFFNIEECKAVQVFFFTLQPGEIRDIHSHDEVRIIFVRSGIMRIRMNGEETDVTGGEIITLYPGVPHGIEVIGQGALNVSEIAIHLKEK